LFRNLVRDRGFLRCFRGSGSGWRSFAAGLAGPRGAGDPLPAPLFFVDKTPYGSHQMGHGDVNAPFPENLRDPVHAETATMRLQDFVLILTVIRPVQNKLFEHRNLDSIGTIGP